MRVKLVSIILTLVFCCSVVGCAPKSTESSLSEESASSLNGADSKAESTDKSSESSEAVKEGKDAISESELSNDIAFIQSMPEEAKSTTKGTNSGAPSSKGKGASSSKSSNASSNTSSNTSSSKSPSSANTAAAPIVETQDGFSSTAIEQQVFKLVNQERTANGLSSFSWNNTLQQSARIRSDEMAQNGEMSHTRPNGTGWETSFDIVNYTGQYEQAGENLAVLNNIFFDDQSEGTDSAAKYIFDAWKNSPAHYENMMSADFTLAGVSATRIDADVYVAMHYSYEA